MHLKNRFCQIHTDHRILCHVSRPFRSVASTPLIWHIAMPSGEGGSHPIYFGDNRAAAQALAQSIDATGMAPAIEQPPPLSRGCESGPWPFEGRSDPTCDPLDSSGVDPLHATGKDVDPNVPSCPSSKDQYLKSTPIRNARPTAPLHVSLFSGPPHRARAPTRARLAVGRVVVRRCVIACVQRCLGVEQVVDVGV